MFLNCYLRNYGYIVEYLLVVIIILLYFQKIDIFLYIWYVYVYIYVNGYLLLGMYVYFCYYVESFMECVFDKLYIIENVLFFFNVFLILIYVYYYICNSCWNL